MVSSVLEVVEVSVPHCYRSHHLKLAVGLYLNRNVHFSYSKVNWATATNL